MVCKLHAAPQVIRMIIIITEEIQPVSKVGSQKNTSTTMQCECKSWKLLSRRRPFPRGGCIDVYTLSPKQKQKMNHGLWAMGYGLWISKRFLGCLPSHSALARDISTEALPDQRVACQIVPSIHKVRFGIETETSRRRQGHFWPSPTSTCLAFLRTACFQRERVTPTNHKPQPANRIPKGAQPTDWTRTLQTNRGFPLFLPHRGFWLIMRIRIIRFINHMPYY